MENTMKIIKKVIDTCKAWDAKFYSVPSTEQMKDHVPTLTWPLFSSDDYNMPIDEKKEDVSSGKIKVKLENSDTEKTDDGLEIPGFYL